MIMSDWSTLIISPGEGHKWFDQISANESPIRIGLYSSLSAKSSFYLPAFEISRSCPTASEGNPGQQAHNFLIRILSTSLTSVSNFSVCCCSRYISLYPPPPWKERKENPGWLALADGSRYGQRSRRLLYGSQYGRDAQPAQRIQRGEMFQRQFSQNDIIDGGGNGRQERNGDLAAIGKSCTFCISCT
jgi:hypothetical protein